jgi:hypothetical protein
MSDGAILDMQDSEMIYEIGGLLQVTGGSTRVSNSTIGALGIRVPNGAHLDASGLQSGTFFEHWNVQDMIPEANYELTLDDVTLLKDDFTGEYQHGPYERGWIFFLDPDSHVRLSDSELRKVFLEVNNDSVEFKDLRIGEPSDLQYRDILLEDVVVEGEWPFTINDSNVTFINSNYLFLQPGGASTVELIDSHMVEFIPRNFYGIMKFTHAEWTNAGEILGEVDYHSMGNNFTMTGSLKISADVRDHLQWKDAQVTRVYEVFLFDSNGAPINRGVIKIEGREYATDENGKTEFSFVFNDDNYNQPVLVEAWNSGNLVSKIVFDFFTETPILISP